jgi:hypothetical protein
MDVFLTILYLETLLLLGFCTLRLVADREKVLHAEYWLPVSFALGVGVQGCIYLASVLLIGKMIVPVLLGVLVLLAVIPLVAPGRFAALSRFAGFDFLRGPSDPALRAPYWAMVTLIVLFCSVMFFNALSYPMASYDGRAIWNFKGKALFYDRTPFSEVFLDGYRSHYHPDYPILIPVAQFGLYAFLGRVDDDLVRFFFSALMLFFLFFIYDRLREPCGRMTALFFTLIFAGMPFREFWVVLDAGGINSGEADFPLSVFATIAATSYLLWWRTRRTTELILGAVFTGFCLMTKKEGLVIFCVMLGANGIQWLVGAGQERAGRFKGLVIANVLTLLVALPWFLVGSGLKNIYDEDYFASFSWEKFATSYQRIPLIFHVFWNDITEIDKWNFLWVIYLPLLFIGMPWWLGNRGRFFPSMIMLWMLAYVVVYCLSPLNLVFHLNTSLRRLLAHMIPLVLIQIALAFAWSRARVLDVPVPPNEFMEPSR